MAQKLLADIDRFCAAVVVTSTGCWLWQLAADKDGYGLFKIGSRTDGTRRQARAHRWAYEYFIGPIPAGLQLDHLCRVHACVNPLHTEPVTTTINTKRGRRATATHCKQGHRYTAANTYVTAIQRVCRTCARKWSAKYRERQKRGVSSDTVIK